MPIPLLTALPLIFQGISTAADVTKAGFEIAGDNAQKDKLVQMKAASPMIIPQGPPSPDLVAAIEAKMEEAKLASLDVPEELA